MLSATWRTKTRTHTPSAASQLHTMLRMLRRMPICKSLKVKLWRPCAIHKIWLTSVSARLRVTPTMEHWETAVRRCKSRNQICLTTINWRAVSSRDSLKSCELVSKKWHANGTKMTARGIRLSLYLTSSRVKRMSCLTTWVLWWSAMARSLTVS